ncbi:MAG: helix-turn-helix domain-containing protein [Planctomycetes bacterium]|nr:helix-turn-helix domain-containing protein [Planctomycetota bacterium]
MQIVIETKEFRPLIEKVVVETYDRFLHDWIAKTEAKAAELCDVPKHVLRDARLRGEVEHGKIGSKIVYTRRQLLDFLEGRNGD